MTEVELCRATINWLIAQHWDVYQEVQLHTGGPIRDMVAVRSGVLWMIEAKTSQSLTVIDQALRNKPWCHMSSIAVPPSKRDSGRSLCHALGIGLIEVSTDYSGTPYVQDRLRPSFIRLNNEYVKSMVLPRLRDQHKTGEFGEAGNARGDRWSPYKQTIDDIRRFLKEHGPATTAQICAKIDHHYSSDKSAKQTIAVALTKWEKGFKRERAGRQFLYSVTGEQP